MNMWTNPSVSKKMLERYSHIRTQAKKAAIATLDQFGSKAQNDSILGEIGHKNGHSQCAEASGDSPNSLETNGGPTRTRTWDQRIMSPSAQEGNTEDKALNSASSEQIRQSPQPRRKSISQPNPENQPDGKKGGAE